MNAPLNALSPAAVDLAGMLAQIDNLRMQLAALESTALGGMAKPGFRLYPGAWVQRLADIVAFEFGIETTDLMGSCRHAHFTRPRFIWVWLVRTVSNRSYPETARLTGYGDHTSVMHACQRVESWRKASTDFALVTDQLLSIGRALRAPPPAVEPPSSEGETA